MRENASIGLDALEQYGRHENVRIVGIPEPDAESNVALTLSEKIRQLAAAMEVEFLRLILMSATDWGRRKAIAPITLL